jgi:CheY-like chemotaxis protein
MEEAGGQFTAALTALEQKAFGHTHLDVAAAMMHDWGLPKLFTDAVLFHEDPSLADFGMESRSGRLANCLHLATKIAHLCFVPQPGRAAEFVRLLPLAKELGIPDGNLVALGDQMLREWKDWSTMLELGVREVVPFSALEAEPEGQASSAPETLTQLDILVVDDDPTVCLVLKKLLSAAGHTVHLARDGHEGLALALQFQPNLVITDLMMARHDGLQLIRSLRQTEFGRSIYIMVLTILDDEDKLAEAFDCGADDYLTKPVESKPLLARLKAGMRMIREQQALRQEQEELRRRLLELSIANQRAQEAALTDVLTGL